MDPEHRRQLARLARKRGARRVADVNRWKPGTVNNPEDDQPYTEAAAWEFLAKGLEDLEQSLDEITLEKPPGKTGFVMKCPQATRVVYIKFRTERDRTILGISFHYEHEG